MNPPLLIPGFLCLLSIHGLVMSGPALVHVLLLILLNLIQHVALSLYAVYHII